MIGSLLYTFITFLTRCFYRIRLVDSGGIPGKGPCLLVSNHLSLVDGFLIGTSLRRRIRFLIWRPYYEAPLLHPFLKRMGAIPISETDPPKEILRSLQTARKALENGEVVCIFAEGQISRTGNLLEFKRGAEVIVKGLDVPVIPVHLDRVWGSIFSFEHGKAIWKMPRQIPYPVTITYGTPIRSTLTPETMRQAVLDLSTDAFQHRLNERHPLGTEFLISAKKHPWRLAVADSSNRKLSYGKLAAASLTLCKEFQSQRAPIGILLPPCVPAVVVNLAVSFAGRVPINLNYTVGQNILLSCAERANIQEIWTSRRFLEKLQLAPHPSFRYVEDLPAILSKKTVLRNWIRFLVQPLKRQIRHLKQSNQKNDTDLATILFSSGSTGIPKGVMLTHNNILSNILALTQVIDLGAKDHLVGVLPFFHSFGYTATLWLPLLQGFSVTYHVNPLDARVIGDLIEKTRATLFLATPTFLSAYIRKCKSHQFKTLRYIIVGAERLRETIASAFQEHFGKTPLEGYGCTELSPVVAVNIPNISMGEIHQVGHKPGTIGHPIPGVSVKIVDPDTFEPLPQGSRGLLLVKGPNVMKGYLNEPEKTLAVMKEGWYITGDLAVIDTDGFIRLEDRISRFSKIGGEMVPHLMIEETLQTLSQKAEPSFVVIAVNDEQKGERLIVLHTELNQPLDALYKLLQQSSLPKLWIPNRSDFVQVDQIPVLGSGKLDLVKAKEIGRNQCKSNT